ncbi:TldD/PmbA family protein [Haploplasma axanthum]|uniref:Protease TldD n=1 Tax=Haploplasma axanthum TaxID=29552 RepID=A0A449BF14_HAPAX|nr:TldD/PmbA family protein [Haploplasma axanthum]VEU81026.1 protease TldD [Haploplasma axanthum]
MKKETIQEILNQSLTSGADFGELFFEKTINSGINVMNGEVINIGVSDTSGVGIRLLKGSDEVYGFTNEVTKEEILRLLEQLKASFNDKPGVVAKLGESLPFNNKIEKPFDKVPTKDKTAKLLELNAITRQESDLILQAFSNLIEVKQEILVANTEGIYQNDERIYSRVILGAVAKDGEKMEQGFESQGRFMGFEIFDKIDYKKYAVDVAESAVKQLSAKDIKAGVMPVVIHNGFGGVIFHEACGHPLEASAIAKGLSPFAGKLGQRVASEVVSAYDNGDVEGAWGRLNFDDEGHPTQNNLLIENGILKGYLIDKRNGRTMNAKSTGSSRRQSYKYSPTSRMNSTFIANGKDNYEDIIKDTKFGLFAKKLGGGTVNPTTGEFNFAVQEGYMIEDGKLTDAVKGAMLIGNGKDILFEIDRVANNLEFGQGMCGASSGSIPVDVGQPTIRVKKITVGGLGDE